MSQADSGCAAARLSSASHPISPLFAISRFPIPLRPPPLVQPTHCTFLSPQQTAAASHSPVIPTVCRALPAQPVLSALFCLSVLFSLCPTWALGPCFWHVLCLPPIPGLSCGVLPLQKLYSLSRNVAPSQHRNQHLNLVLGLFFFLLHAIVICRGPIGHVYWFEYYCQSLFSIDDERVKSCHNANLMIVPC